MSDPANRDFKLGVFSANADRGLTFTTVPEAWKAEWDDIAAACKIADHGGHGFFSADRALARLWRFDQGARMVVRDLHLGGRACGASPSASRCS